MNKFLKYILFFLLGFIIYLLIINKLIEGYENELTLLFNILKDRTDIGCYNYPINCKDDHQVNPHSRWEKKIDFEDENSLLCNNSSEYSIVSLLNSGNRCNNELCCDDNSCEKRFFSEGNSCLGRDEYPNRLCSREHENVDDCFDTCCGTLQTGPSKSIYDNIKAFRDKVNANTIREFGQERIGRCGTSNEYLLVFSEIQEGTITGLDLRNFIYFNLLDLDHIRNTHQDLSRIGTTINLINYHDFECIHEYITTLYNEIIHQPGTQVADEVDATEKIQNIKINLLNNNIFTTNTRLKIKEELSGDKTFSEYSNQLDPGSHTIFSERLLGTFNNEHIKTGFTNFIKYHTNEDGYSNSVEGIQHNTPEDLIKNLKLTVLMIANPIINDQEKTQLDILLGSTNNQYIERIINATELKYIM